MKIGFVGLGIMGSRMAMNLLEAGYDLIVYNRTSEKGEPHRKAGAEWGASPAEVAAESDVMFTMLSTPDVVAMLALGEEGFLNAFRPGAIWVNSTTVDPFFTYGIAEEAADRGVRFVDAPVAGTKGPAEEGTLLFLVGGDDEDVETCRPLFDVMGRKTIHAGESGMGSALKMVVNLLLGQAMVAFSEAMALGQGLGLDRDLLFESLLGGPVTAPFVSAKREMIEGDSYEAAFPLKWMQKDLHLAAMSAYEVGVAMPAGNTVKEVFRLAARYGLAEKDFAAVYRFINAEIEPDEA